MGNRLGEMYFKNMAIAPGCKIGLVWGGVKQSCIICMTSGEALGPRVDISNAGIT